MIATQLQHLVQPLTEFTRSLITQRGEAVEIINQVINKQHILLSTADLSNPSILKNNPMPVDLYINNVLMPRAIDEISHRDNDKDRIMKLFEEFEMRVMNQLMNIKNLMIELSFEIDKRKPSSFLNDFSNGVFKDANKFMISLEDMIAYAATSSESKASKFNRISQLLTNLNQPLKDIEDGLMLEKKIMGMSECVIPKSFELIDQVEINNGKSIPWTNGIDFHPINNVYVAMGCNDGDLVIRDQNINKEINRIKLNNNSDGATQNCLWSPSGDKFMVSTMKNHSIYIYDETGQRLLKSMENTYSQSGFGAIWLSEHEVGVGYNDGMVKFFNIEEGKEIGNGKVNEKYVRGMDCLDGSHLLVGDRSGSITNIDWKNNKIEWIKIGWHSNNNGITCLKVNQDKTKLLTSGDDYFLKMMKLQNQSKLCQFKLNSFAMGISWIPGELYVLALSNNSQLVALNSNDGTKIVEFNELSAYSMSLSLNPRTAEVLIGDGYGKIRRLKICQA